MKTGFLYRWLENRVTRKRIIRSLACNIELCRNSTRRAIEKAQAGEIDRAYDMYETAQAVDRDAAEVSDALWAVSGGRLNKRELALLKEAENLYQEVQEAEQAIEDAEKIKH